MKNGSILFRLMLSFFPILCCFSISGIILSTSTLIKKISSAISLTWFGLLASFSSKESCCFIDYLEMWSGCVSLIRDVSYGLLSNDIILLATGMPWSNLILKISKKPMHFRYFQIRKTRSSLKSFSGWYGQMKI